MKKILTTLLALTCMICLTCFGVACNDTDDEKADATSVTAEEWKSAFEATLGAENVTCTHTMEYKAEGSKAIVVTKLDAANLAVSVLVEIVSSQESDKNEDIISCMQNGADMVKNLYTRSSEGGSWSDWRLYTDMYESASAKDYCIERYGSDNVFYSALPNLSEMYAQATFNEDTVTYLLAYDFDDDWQGCQWTLQFVGKKLTKIEVKGKEVCGDSYAEYLDFVATFTFSDFGTTSITVPALNK